MSRRPAFQFYPSDWRTDAGLRLCSIGARGLWIEMMTLMHDGEPYGHLTMQGRVIDNDMLARLVGENSGTIKKLTKELELNGVFSRTAEGVIYSRRMIRDEEVRERRAAGGQEGAEHGAKGASHGKKGGRPRNGKPPSDDEEGGIKTPLDAEEKPPPSSSSPSSSSEEKSSVAIATGGEPPNVTALDVAKAIFDTGKTILKDAGIPDRQTGSIIGRFRKSYSDSQVLAVLSRCQVEQPSEPIEWITKALQAEQRQASGQANGYAHQPARESTRQIGERLAARLAG